MNEKRFIQLINLYIDGEISPGELEELENEVVRDTRRRQTFQNYCRLQRASQAVYRKLGSALTETVDLRKYQILARDSSRCFQRRLWCSLGAVAAACVAVAAAVSVFQDAYRGTAGGGRAFENSYGHVEVFEPSKTQKRNADLQLATTRQQEPFFFAGRPASVRPQQRAEFLDPARPGVRDAFRSAQRQQIWEEFGPANTPRVIRGDSGFDAELASFQFQR